MRNFETSGRKKGALLAAGTLLAVTACGGQPQNVNDASAKAKGVKIFSTYEYDAKDRCTSRTDTVTLKVGQFAVLGEYNDLEGGWRINHPAANQVEVKETSEDTDTFLNNDLSDRHGDLRKDTVTPVTLPAGFSGKLAEYSIHDGSSVNGNNSRKGEYGTFTVVNNADASVSVSVASVFDTSHGSLDEGYCPDKK